MTMETRCHCGQPLHYVVPEIKALVEQQVAELGEYTKVTIAETGRAFLVPSHYIALHGVKGRELASLGFEEVK